MGLAEGRRVDAVGVSVERDCGSVQDADDQWAVHDRKCDSERDRGAAARG